MRELAEACPRFLRCSVNACPLHTDYQDTLQAHPNDPQRVCRLSKARRLGAAARYPELAARLRFKGLSPREYHAAERMKRLSEDEREALRERGREMTRRRLRARQRTGPEPKVGLSSRESVALPDPLPSRGRRLPSGSGGLFPTRRTSAREGGGHE